MARGRACKVCEHKDGARIELELAAGRSHRSVGAEFGLSKDCLVRHWRNHVSGARKAELVAGPVAIAKLAKRAAEEDRSLLDYMSILRSELLHLFLYAKEKGLTFDAASIAQRLLNVLEAIGRLNGQLRQAGIVINNSVNAAPTIVLNDPSVIKMQSTIIRALASFPEARAAVVAALRELDGQTGMGMNGRHGPPLAVCGPTVEARADA
jgi:hypothetical protein